MVPKDTSRDLSGRPVMSNIYGLSCLVQHDQSVALSVRDYKNLNSLMSGTKQVHDGQYSKRYKTTTIFVLAFQHCLPDKLS